MATSLAQFHKHLSADELCPVYLIVGEEHLLVLEAADALRARARDQGYGERDVLDVDSHFDWNDLARAGASMSLFATRRLIDLRLPTGKPGREGAAALVEFMRQPPPDTVLLITATQWSKKHEGAWVSALAKAGMFVPVWPMKPSEFQRWIAQRMRSRGLVPDREAIAALVARVEGNSLAAAQEIDKLALLHGDGALDAVTLESLVADSARFDVFKLVDAAFAGDSSRALRILSGLRAEGEQVPALMGWLLNQLQLLARLANAGSNLTAALRAERVWSSREGMYRKVLSRAPRGHWQQCLLQAGEVDRLSKGRGQGDPWLALERLLFDIARPGALNAAH